MGQFFVGVISGLVTSFIGLLIKIIYQYIKYFRKSKYSGRWINEIYDENNKIIKQDIAIIKHNKRTNCITGKIHRNYPYEENTKRWNCNGVITDNHIMAAFWSKQLIKSDGCVYAVFTNDYTYEGWYLKETQDGISRVKIRLTKENQSPRCSVLNMNC